MSKKKLLIILFSVLTISIIGILVMLTNMPVKEQKQNETEKYIAVQCINNIKIAVPERFYSQAKDKYEYINEYYNMDTLEKSEEEYISYSEKPLKTPVGEYIYDMSIGKFIMSDNNYIYINCIRNVDLGYNIESLKQLVPFIELSKRFNIEGIKEVSPFNVEYEKEKNRLIADVDFTLYGTFTDNSREGDEGYEDLELPMKGKIVILEEDGEQHMLVIGNRAGYDKIDEDMVFSTSEINNMVKYFGTDSHNSSLIVDTFSGDYTSKTQILGTDVELSISDLKVEMDIPCHTNDDEYIDKDSHTYYLMPDYQIGKLDEDVRECLKRKSFFYRIKYQNITLYRTNVRMIAANKKGIERGVSGVEQLVLGRYGSDISHEGSENFPDERFYRFFYVTSGLDYGANNCVVNIGGYPMSRFNGDIETAKKEIVRKRNLLDDFNSYNMPFFDEEWGTDLKIVSTEEVKDGNGFYHMILSSKEKRKEYSIFYTVKEDCFIWFEVGETRLYENVGLELIKHLNVYKTGKVTDKTRADLLFYTIISDFCIYSPEDIRMAINSAELTEDIKRYVDEKSWEKDEE